ncbi:MAG: hypothetical protein GY868_13535, partial [Deltaproteobacteria bacterium]|nr:hypothetical protein [Deltaproteobacteria bacterium]
MRKQHKTHRKTKQASEQAGPTLIARSVALFDQYGFLLLLGTAPFVFTNNVGHFENIPKIMYLVWGAVLLALLRLMRYPQPREPSLQFVPLDYAVVLFYGCCWLSLLQAVNPYQAAVPVIHWGAAVGLYFLLRSMPKSTKVVSYFFFVSGLSCGLVSILGICQYAFNVDWVPQVVPPASTFTNRNMASQFVALCFPLTMGAVLAAKKLWQKLLFVGVLLAETVYLLCTQTRSAWLAVVTVIFLGVVFLPFFVVQIRAAFTLKKMLVGAVFMITICAAALWLTTRESLGLDVDALRYRLFSIVNISDNQTASQTAQLRLIWWKNSLHMVKDNLWLGVGPGNFKVHYPRYANASAQDWSFSEEFQAQQVHNDHLQMLVELGVTGGVAYAGMFVFFLYAFICLWRRSEPAVRMQAVVLLLGVVSLSICALFSFSLQRAMTPLYLVALFALLLSLYQHPQEAAGKRVALRRSGGARLLSGVVIVLFLMISTYFLRCVIFADRAYCASLSLYERGRYAEAIVRLPRERIYMCLEPNIYASRIRASLNLGRYDDALSQYFVAKKVLPYNVNLIRFAGLCYFNQ